jgi:hypothetical protein
MNKEIISALLSKTRIMKLFTGIILFLAGWTASGQAQLPDYLKRPGPKNIGDYSFIFIHVIRDNEPENNAWFGLHINDKFIARIKDSCKYTLQYPLQPIKIRFSYAKEKDIEIKSPVPGSHYYFKAVNVNEKQSQSQFSFFQLEENTGREEFDKAALNNYSLEYPQVLAGEVTALTKNNILAFLTDEFKNDSIYNIYIKYRMPDWFNCILIYPSADHLFSYANEALSKTYSEYLKFSLVEKGIKISGEEELINYVNKIYKDGKALLSGKKEKLQLYEQLHDKVPGRWTSSVYYITYDFGTPAKGKSDYLEKREIRSIFYYSLPGGDKGDLWQVEYSVRGLDNELWSKDEMLNRINSFLSGMRFP